MIPRSRDDASPVLRLVPGRGSADPAGSHETSNAADVAPLLDDAEILAGLRAGDVTAVGALHDRARRVVERTIARVLGRRDVDADDLAQMSLIQLVLSMARFRGDCSLDTWISRITANTVFNELARRKTSRRIFAEGFVDVASSADVERDLGDRGTLGRIRKHLDAIEPNKAWTVVLHDVCGYDLREISEITEVSVAAAQTRLVRGRRELHALIEQDPDLADVLRERRRSR